MIETVWLFWLLEVGAANVHVSPAFADEPSCNADRVRALEMVTEEFKDVKRRVRIAASECFALPVLARGARPK